MIMTYKQLLTDYKTMLYALRLCQVECKQYTIRTSTKFTRSIDA